jgi:hypothetical protein
LKTFLDLVKEEKELHILCSMINHYAQGKEIPTENKVVNQLLRKKRTKKSRFSTQIGEYDIDNVILDLGSDVNMLPKKTWEMMGKPNLVWSCWHKFLRIGSSTGYQQKGIPK